jgi:acetyltransferase
MTTTPEINPPLDASNDPGRIPRSSLDPLSRPRSVAVVGATDKQGSVGRTLPWNLAGGGVR